MRPPAVLVIVLSPMIPEFLGCNVHVKPKNRAKIVEDYILSANFDERKDIPQLIDQVRDAFPEAKDASDTFLSYKGHGGLVGDIEDRDLLIHHHHVPPLHPPPPPPPPVGLALGPSMFAMGLMAFLILLNGLSSQLLMVLKAKPGGLLSTTGSNILGRRRRRRRRRSISYKNEINHGSS